MGLQYPRRNRFLYSLKSLEVQEGAELWKGITQFSVAVEIEGRDPLYGTGVYAYGKPRGQVKIDVTCRFEGKSFYEFHKAHPQFLDEFFDIVGTLQEGADRDTIELRQLTFEGANPVEVEGTEAMEVEISGSAIEFLINGEPVMHGDALGQSGAAGAA